MEMNMEDLKVSAAVAGMMTLMVFTAMLTLLQAN